MWIFWIIVAVILCILYAKYQPKIQLRSDGTYLSYADSAGRTSTRITTLLSLNLKP
jgi:hypothetical protein